MSQKQALQEFLWLFDQPDIPVVTRLDDRVHHCPPKDYRLGRFWADNKRYSMINEQAC